MGEVQLGAITLDGLDEERGRQPGGPAADGVAELADAVVDLLLLAAPGPVGVGLRDPQHRGKRAVERVVGVRPAQPHAGQGPPVIAVGQGQPRAGVARPVRHGQLHGHLHGQAAVQGEPDPLEVPRRDVRHRLG